MNDQLTFVVLDLSNGRRVWLPLPSSEKILAVALGVLRGGADGGGAEDVGTDGKGGDERD